MTVALAVLHSPRWTAIYRSKKHPSRQVVVNSAEEPTKTREFFIPQTGEVVFTAVSITKLTEPKEGWKMARKRKASTKSKKKKKDEEELEELEGLDDLDEDEPDDEDEDDEDTEDDEDSEDEDDDEDDEDEDEDEEPPKKRSKKSKSKKSSSSKKKKSSGSRGPTGPRELPKGKLSAQDIAEMADTDARTVRLFLRKKANKKKYPKDKELGRYAFTKTDAKAIVKAINAASSDEDDE